MLDIEFVTQTAILHGRLVTEATSTPGMIDALAEKYTPWKKASAELKSIYLNLREFEQILQLSAALKTVEAKNQSATFAKAAGLMGMKPQTAWENLQGLIARARLELNPLDPTGLQF